MSDLKICNMGHYYQSNLGECPYCPSPYRKNENTTFDIEPNEEKTQLFAPMDDAPAPKPELVSSEKTQIVFNQPEQAASVGSRKLVGWLVTFDHHPSGKDFKLYEGRNTVGTQSSCDIVLDFDNAVSARHATILFRANEFLFQDELSTNGTFLNGELKNSGSLHDGDVLKFAETSFLFRKAF